MVQDPEAPATVHVFVPSCRALTVNELGVPAIAEPLLTTTETLPSSPVATGVAGIAGGSCKETFVPVVLLTAAMLLRGSTPTVVNCPPR